MAHKRTRHSPSRYQDIVATEGSPPNRKVQCGVTYLALGKLGARVHVHSNKELSICTMYIYICVLAHTVFTIVLHTSEEEHTVPLEALESTAGLPLQKKEAVIVMKWWCGYTKVRLYEATIVGARVATRESAVQEEAEV